MQTFEGLAVRQIEKRAAISLVVQHHYLHRKPPISHSFGIVAGDTILGVCTFGTPPSRHAQLSVCPDSPSSAIELNRLWVCDSLGTNTESWFVSRCLNLLPAAIVFSYADSAWGHSGIIYRALNFHYAGWTDMERKTSRFDYIALSGGHSRDAFRTGFSERVRRKPKAKYWTVTGSRLEKRKLAKMCGWPRLDWRQFPPPSEHRQLLQLN
jgi:hypothetical protein